MLCSALVLQVITQMACVSIGNTDDTKRRTRPAISHPLYTQKPIITAILSLLDPNTDNAGAKAACGLIAALTPAHSPCFPKVLVAAIPKVTKLVSS